MQHLFADPQVRHRGMVAEIPHPTIGTLQLTGIPVRHSETPGAIRRPPPLLGEHTDDVLAEVLGYTPEKIASLKDRGTI